MANITISPTSASGLSGAVYTVTLPAPRQFSVVPIRAYETTRAIAGNAIHSVWPTSVTTATPRYQQQISETQYQALRVLCDHTTVTTWMLGADGRVFEVALVLESADRVQVGSVVKREVDLKFLIVREVSV